jgi:hypothetical protein
MKNTKASVNFQCFLKENERMSEREIPAAEARLLSAVSSQAELIRHLEEKLVDLTWAEKPDVAKQAEPQAIPRTVFGGNLAELAARVECSNDRLGVLLDTLEL